LINESFPVFLFRIFASIGAEIALKIPIPNLLSVLPENLVALYNCVTEGFFMISHSG